MPFDRDTIVFHTPPSRATASTSGAITPGVVCPRTKPCGIERTYRLLLGACKKAKKALTPEPCAQTSLQHRLFLCAMQKHVNAGVSFHLLLHRSSPTRVLFQALKQVHTRVSRNMYTAAFFRVARLASFDTIQRFRKTTPAAARAPPNHHAPPRKHVPRVVQRSEEHMRSAASQRAVSCAVDIRVLASGMCVRCTCRSNQKLPVFPLAASEQACSRAGYRARGGVTRVGGCGSADAGSSAKSCFFVLSIL